MSSSRNRLTLVILVGIITILTPIITAYHPAVHEYISNESRESWKLVPNEIKEHLSGLNSNNEVYDIADEIITGSVEEDNGRLSVARHFWDPDDPNTPSMLGIDDYNDGVFLFGSSYRKAEEYWNTKVIPLYLTGKVDESYYWLGRVAHLLEDAASPLHVYLEVI